MVVPDRLDEKVVAITAELRRRTVAHAIGGAIALGYYGEPRGTVDIDLNVFLSTGRADRALDALDALGIAFDRRGVTAEIRSTGQVSLEWDVHRLDLFFMNHPFHDSCAKRVRDVPFGDDNITILAAEDLLLFKVAFNRRKDWIDIEQVLFATAGSFDLNYLRRWARSFFDHGDQRMMEMEATIAKILGPDA